MSDANIPELLTDWVPPPPKTWEIGVGNHEREIGRLLGYLNAMCCQRSPFLGSPDCADIPDYPVREWCLRCRALSRYGLRGAQAKPSTASEGGSVG